VGVGLLTALITGLVLGAVARSAMAVLALAGTGRSTVTAGGSLFIVLVYAVAALPGALAAALTARRWRWAPAVAGALLLTVPAIGVGSEEVGGMGGLGAGRLVVAVAAGLVVLATVALLPLVTVRLAERLSSGRRIDAAPA
jgi:hypothetical protein